MAHMAATATAYHEVATAIESLVLATGMAHIADAGDRGLYEVIYR